MYSSSLLERTSLRTDVRQEQHIHGVFINKYVGGRIRKSKYTTHTCSRSSLVSDYNVNGGVTRSCGAPSRDCTRHDTDTPEHTRFCRHRGETGNTARDCLTAMTQRGAWRERNHRTLSTKSDIPTFAPRVYTPHISRVECLGVLASGRFMNGNTGMMWEKRVVAYFKVLFQYLVEAAVKITTQDFRLSGSCFTFVQNPSESNTFLIRFHN